MNSKLMILLALLLAVFETHALPTVPGKEQQRPLAIVGATVHVGNGTVLENAVVAFDKGVITHVGGMDDFDASAYQLVEAGGQHVYPGIIAPVSTIGLKEIGGVRATIDDNERGSMNPSVRALTTFNTDSEFQPTLRFNGVLIAQSTPNGGLVSGQSAIMNMDGWNWQDAVLQADDGLHVNFPSEKRRQFDMATFSMKVKKNKNYQAQLDELAALFAEARAYLAAKPGHGNQKLESLEGVFAGSKRVYLHVQGERNIVRAVQFAKDHELAYPVLVGSAGMEAVADFLASEKIPVILGTTHTLPANADQAVDLPFRRASMLAKAGVLTGMYAGGGGRGPGGPMNDRNLMFAAGTAAAYGLGMEKALQMITLNNAKILGVEEKVGSLEVGKQASLFISEGNALDMRGNRVALAWIAGKSVDLHGMQQELYQRYHEKYQQVGE